MTLNVISAPVAGAKKLLAVIVPVNVTTKMCTNRRKNGEPFFSDH